MIKSFGPDDWTMLGTQILNTAYLACQLGGLIYGTGRHIEDLDPERAQTALTVCTLLRLQIVLLLLMHAPVLALLRNLLCTYYKPSQSQHWLLPAASCNQQTPRVDCPYGDDPHRAFRTHTVLRIPLTMKTGQRILVSRSPRRSMFEQHRTSRIGLCHLGTQRCCRLDIRSAAILDRQGLADSCPTETTSDWPARIRGGRIYRDGCALTIRSLAEGEWKGQRGRLPLYV